MLLHHGTCAAHRAVIERDGLRATGDAIYLAEHEEWALFYAHDRALQAWQQACAHSLPDALPIEADRGLIVSVDVPDDVPTDYLADTLEWRAHVVAIGPEHIMGVRTITFGWTVEAQRAARAGWTRASLRRGEQATQARLMDIRQECTQRDRSRGSTFRAVWRAAQ